MGLTIDKVQRYLARLSVVEGPQPWRAEVFNVQETTLLEAETAAALRQELQACVAADSFLEVLDPIAADTVIHLPGELYERLDLEAQLAGQSLDCWIAGLLQRALEDVDRLERPGVQHVDAALERSRSLVSA